MNATDETTQGELVTIESAPVPATTQAATPMLLLEKALESGADLDRLEKLMEMQQTWERNEARKAYVAAMAAFKADPPELHKNKTVAYGNTGYKHATLDHVAAEISKAMAPHGLSFTWDVDTSVPGTILVTCIVTHVQGHSERVSLPGAPDTSGSKNAIQATGSTVTYLQRYTLLAATGLAAKDQDDDGRGSEPVEYNITDEQAAEIDALFDEVGANKDRWYKHWGVEKTSDIKQGAQYDSVIKALEDQRK